MSCKSGSALVANRTGGYEEPCLTARRPGEAALPRAATAARRYPCYRMLATCCGFQGPGRPVWSRVVGRPHFAHELLMQECAPSPLQATLQAAELGHGAWVSVRRGAPGRLSSPLSARPLLQARPAAMAEPHTHDDAEIARLLVSETAGPARLLSGCLVRAPPPLRRDAERDQGPAGPARRCQGSTGPPPLAPPPACLPTCVVRLPSGCRPRRTLSSTTTTPTAGRRRRRGRRTMTATTPTMATRARRARRKVREGGRREVGGGGSMLAV